MRKFREKNIAMVVRFFLQNTKHGSIKEIRGENVHISFFRDNPHLKKYFSYNLKEIDFESNLLANNL